jgi:hypothetical protein
METSNVRKYQNWKPSIWFGFLSLKEKIMQQTGLSSRFDWQVTTEQIVSQFHRPLSFTSKATRRNDNSSFVAQICPPKKVFVSSISRMLN